MKFELGSLSFPAGTVTFRGIPYDALMVPAAVSLAIRLCLPDPVPPEKPDPKRGSLAPTIADHDDPEHQERLINRRSQRRAAEVAVSLGMLEIDIASINSEDERRSAAAIAQARPAVIAAVASLHSRITDFELSSLFEQVKEIGILKQAEAGLKNSSGPAGVATPAGTQTSASPMSTP